MSIEHGDTFPQIREPIKQRVKKITPPSLWEAARRLKQGFHDLTANSEQNVVYPFIHVATIGNIRASFNITGLKVLDRVVTFIGESDFLEDFLNTIEPGSTILDIGASTGPFTIPAAIIAREAGQVIAFEPDHESAALIKKNVALNGLNNTRVFELAASENDEILNLHTNGPNSASPQVTRQGEKIRGDFSDYNNEVVVKGVAVGSFLVGHGIKAIDVAKFDVEGFEVPALKGLTDHMLPKHIFIEIHPKLGVDLHTIRSMLKAKGYSLVSDPIQRGREFLCHYVLKDQHTPQ